MADTSLQLTEFVAKINKVNCSVSFDQWRDIINIRGATKKARALNALTPQQLNEIDAVEALSVDEMARLKTIYSYNTMFPTVTRYRKYMKDKGFDNHVVMSFFKMQKKEYGYRRGAYRRKTKNDMVNLRPLFDAKRLIKRAEWLLGSDSYINIAMGLCLLTGRRPTEILYTAHFTKTGEYSAKFTGQLKTKDSDNVRDFHHIYLLSDTDRIIKALARLRSLKNFNHKKPKAGETKGQMINSLTANAQNKAVRRYLMEFIPDFMRSNGKIDKLHPYCLRPAYATLAWQFYGEDWINKQNAVDAEEVIFFAEMLGHCVDDTATAQSYMDFSSKYIEQANPSGVGSVISISDLSKEANNA